MKVKCQNAKWDCVLAHVLRYMKQNCISENQLTLNWTAEYTGISNVNMLLPMG